jgi:hypothetical protein
MSMYCKYCGTTIMEDNIDYCYQCVEDCDDCGGASYINKSTESTIKFHSCETCNGTGKTRKEKIDG